MSASPIPHTEHYTAFIYLRVAACGVAIFKIFLIRVEKKHGCV